MATQRLAQIDVLRIFYYPDNRRIQRSVYPHPLPNRISIAEEEPSESFVDYCDPGIIDCVLRIKFTTRNQWNIERPEVVG